MSVAPEPVQVRGERAKAIYDREIRGKVEPQLNGKLIAVDVESGEYEIDDVGSLAAERLHARRPNADVFVLRVGFPTAFRLGGFARMPSP